MTVLQNLIGWIKTYDVSYSVSDIIEAVMKNEEQLLQQEREQMERCFEAGWNNGNNAAGRGESVINFDTFFTTQFNNK